MDIPNNHYCGDLPDESKYEDEWDYCHKCENRLHEDMEFVQDCFGFDLLCNSCYQEIEIWHSEYKREKKVGY